MNDFIEVLQWFVIPAAFVLDAVVGDPPNWPHPIRWMGRAIALGEPVFRKKIKNEYIAGIFFALSLIFAVWLLTALLLYSANQLHPLAGIVLEVILICFSLSARCLNEAGMDIYHCLKKGGVNMARSKVAMIVGRDVHRYEADDIARATVETVAENFVDGVLSPLFFAALGGAPLAMAYKMINTLDSMVGYKNLRYLRFGRVAARIDDIANYLPARLSVVIISFSAGLLDANAGRRALKTALIEGAHHSSPNAGYSEAAFAGALRVRLNGPNDYNGVRIEKPYIGVAFGSVALFHIKKGCDLMIIASLTSLALAWAISVGWT